MLYLGYNNITALNINFDLYTSTDTDPTDPKNTLQNLDLIIQNQQVKIELVLLTIFDRKTFFQQTKRKDLNSEKRIS